MLDAGVLKLRRCCRHAHKRQRGRLTQFRKLLNVYPLTVNNRFDCFHVSWDCSQTKNLPIFTAPSVEGESVPPMSYVTSQVSGSISPS